MKKRAKKSSDDLRPNYDLRELLKEGVRGKYAKHYQAGTNLILLNPDVLLSRMGTSMNTNIGTEEQWQALFEKHPGLMDAINQLIELTGKCAGSVKLPSLAHKIVFALCNVCMEECWEILLLVANGYTTGAMKLLRGLYERALTLSYISQSPDKAQRFVDYGYIQEHRIISPALKIVTEEVLNQKIKPQTVAEIRQNYQEHKASFQQTDCKTCKTTRLAHSWDIDITSMAEKVGNGFPQMLLGAYTLPTLQAHSTLASALSRMKSEGNGYTFNYAANPENIDLCIVQTLGLMLIVHRVAERFLMRPITADVNQLEQTLIKTFSTWL